jgi:hypothetical protein
MGSGELVASEVEHLLLARPINVAKVFPQCPNGL